MKTKGGGFALCTTEGKDVRPDDHIMDFFKDGLTGFWRLLDLSFSSHEEMFLNGRGDFMDQIKLSQDLPCVFISRWVWNRGSRSDHIEWIPYHIGEDETDDHRGIGPPSQPATFHLCDMLSARVDL